jgi:hypothetical protein
MALEMVKADRVIRLGYYSTARTADYAGFAR